MESGMTLHDIKKGLELVDEFRGQNASLVVLIHELPGAIDRRDSIEARTKGLFFDLREQVCQDNNLANGTTFGQMSDDVIISELAEEKLRALLDYIRQ
jgi:hypothetical protein